MSNIYGKKRTAYIDTKMNLYTRPVIPLNHETCTLTVDASVGEKTKLHEQVKTAIRNISSDFRAVGEQVYIWTLLGLIFINVL